MLRSIENGNVDMVIIKDLARLGRDTFTLCSLMYLLADHNVAIHSLAGDNDIGMKEMQNLFDIFASLAVDVEKMRKQYSKLRL